MQVNMAGQGYFSGTNKIGGMCLPDFNDNYVYSRQKSGVSNEEYKRQIVEQAYVDFANGQFQNKSDGFVKLMKKYTQEVSPDRRGIITSGLRAVSKNRNGQNALTRADVLEIIFEGKVKYKKMSSDDSEYIEFYDKSGEMVATYSNRGWTMYTTKAEAARQTEMCMIYNAAWRDAKNGVSIASNNITDSEDLQVTFDAKA